MVKRSIIALLGLLFASLSAIAQVELAPVACSSESNLISINADNATTVEFRNRTDQTVRVYWRNYSGVRVLYNTLSPGSGYVQPTFVTHPWIVTNLQDQCVVAYQPVSAAGIATIQVIPLKPGLLLSQTGLTFRSVSGGGNPPPKTIAVLSSSQPIDWRLSTSTLSGGNSWLLATPSSGTSDSAKPAPIVQIGVNPAGLPPGSYYGTVTIAPVDSSKSAQTVSVILNVTTPDVNPGPVVEPTGLLFVGAPGGAAPVAQSFQISNVTSQPLTFTSAFTFATGRFTVQPSAGTVNPGQPVIVTVLPNLTGLVADIYPGSITFTFSDATNRVVNLLLVVAAGAVNVTNSSDKPESTVRAATCAPTKLLPLFTLLGTNFNNPVAWPTPIEIRVVDDCGELLNAGAVIAGFSNGDPPLGLTLVGGGRWAGTWTPRNARTSALTVTVNAQKPDPKLEGTVQLSGAVQLNPNVPIVNSGGVVGAASYNGFPAPGTLISIFGAALSDTQAGATKLPLDTQLATTSAILGGRSLSLVFSSAGQVNAIIPYGLATNARYPLVIQRGNTISVPEPVVIAEAQPAIFTADLTGKGQGYIFKATADGQLILAGPATPVTAGDVLVIYSAGLGAVDPPIDAGTAVPFSYLTRTVNRVSVSIGGVAAEVLFSGLTPGFTGLYQVNAVVPKGITPGNDVPVVLTVASQSSQEVTLAVH